MRTQPIAVDHRKEVNDIRRELTAGGKSKDRSSPSSYGTPKGLSRSPLSSPLVGASSQARLQCSAFQSTAAVTMELSPLMQGVRGEHQQS